MGKRNELERSYCIMRIRELLKDKDEKERFNNAVENLSKLQFDDLCAVNMKAILDHSYKLNYGNFSKYAKEATVIAELAKKKFIHMDRPNDKVSYFIYLASKYDLDNRRVYM